MMMVFNRQVIIGFVVGVRMRNQGAVGQTVKMRID